jgi:hypothetical protein
VKLEDEAQDELRWCRVILDNAGDYSNSIHDGIATLVAERDYLRKQLKERNAIIAQQDESLALDRANRNL